MSELCLHIVFVLQSQIIIVNSTVESKSQSKACNVCRTAYADISEYYASLNTDYGDDLCMDNVDSVCLLVMRYLILCRLQ